MHCRKLFSAVYFLYNHQYIWMSCHSFNRLSSLDFSGVSRKLRPPTWKEWDLLKNSDLQDWLNKTNLWTFAIENYICGLVRYHFWVSMTVISPFNNSFWQLFMTPLPALKRISLESCSFTRGKNNIPGIWT